MPAPITAAEPQRFGPFPRLGYCGSRLDRAAERREDADFLLRLAAHPDARSYIVGGELVVLRKRGDTLDPLFTTAETRALGSATATIFLGLHEGAGRFGVGLAQADVQALKDSSGFLVTDLRSIAVQGLVASDDLSPLAEAKALLHWHARHGHCANCGLATDVVQAGWRRDCAGCSTQHFPRTDPVVIMLVVDGERCLLGRSGRFAPTMWSCLAGYVEPGESIDEAVRRETAEEAGIRCGAVRYYASQPWPFPSSLMIGCFAEALTTEIVVDRNELEDARWFDRNEAASMLLRQHPEGLTTPPPVAIAHHLIRAWLESGPHMRP
jgi:NAD+ diphosphatase